MHYLLASDGLKVRTFSKAEDFLTHASANHVPVVVTDIGWIGYWLKCWLVFAPFHPNACHCYHFDDPSVLKSIHYLLASEGFKVRAFSKAEDFLAHAGTHDVPVVVTDIWMDGVTGLEVLARLCAISPKTRVIVITAREDLAARATAMAIGPVAFFMKPFNDEKFITAVRDALGKSGK